MTDTETFEKLSTTLDVILPSSRKITIREQNGLDDAVLSKVKDSVDGSSLCKFLAGITVMDFSTGLPPTEKEVEGWLVSDKYYAMLSSRIFSLDKELEFEHKCSKCGKFHAYSENLEGYLMDYKVPEGEKDLLLKMRAKKYPHGMEKERTLTLSSKKIVKYEYLTGKGEKSQLAIELDDADKLMELKARNLSLKGDAGVFLPLNDMDFIQLTARDMREIRSDIAINDPQFYGMSEMRCPDSQCGQVDELPLAGNPNFFYPQGI